MNALMEAPTGEHKHRAVRTATRAPTLLEIEQVRALLEDVDLDEWHHAVEDEPFRSVNSEDTDSHEHHTTQTDNSFVTEQTDPDPNITFDQQLADSIEAEQDGSGLIMLQIFRHWESHVMMNMLAGNKRPRPTEPSEQLHRTDELPTHRQYGAVWKQLTDMGHDEELVRMWATENEIIAKGQECYDRISAPVAMQHQDYIVGASRDQSSRILIDGGSSHHNFGTDTVKYRTNIRSITPFPITTSSLLEPIVNPGVVFSPRRDSLCSSSPRRDAFCLASFLVVIPRVRLTELGTSRETRVMPAG